MHAYDMHLIIAMVTLAGGQTGEKGVFAESLSFCLFFYFIFFSEFVQRIDEKLAQC